MSIRYEASGSLPGAFRVGLLNESAALLSKRTILLGEIYGALKTACITDRGHLFNPGSTASFTQEFRLGNSSLGLCLLPPYNPDGHSQLVIDQNDEELFKFQQYSSGRTLLFTPDSQPQAWKLEKAPQEVRLSIVRMVFDYAA
jgi:hypothetical protein